MPLCDFCKRNFVSEKTLKYHKNNAIFCLRIQNRTERIDQVLKNNSTQIPTGYIIKC